MASATARAIFFSRITSHLPQQPPATSPAHSLCPFVSINRRKSTGGIKCRISDVDGGSVSDNFVSTKSGFGNEFLGIANMLKRIELLDNSVISKGVSDSAKDSMKQTLSTMLGLIPSDQFAVTVRVSKLPLNRLLASSIITGYTLWNAEYRLSLMRNLDISSDTSDSLNCWKGEILELDANEEISSADMYEEDTDKTHLQVLEDLSPETLKYIQQLESDLIIPEKELSAQKQESMEIDLDRKNNNDLLKYLRSLEADMLTELSRPSSLEVEEIIQELGQNIMQKLFYDKATSNFIEDSAFENIDNRKDGDNDSHDTISASRDYLAKLLFWCMLLGHHLRGLENRLQLSCVVRLL